MNAPIDVSDIRIETTRLILRPWTMADLEDLYEYASVPGVGEAAGWNHHRSVEESRQILQLFIDHRKTFAIVWKETGKVIGSLGIEKIKDIPEIPEHLQGRELGYVLNKAYWGRGLMTEAVDAVIRYCFGVLHYDYLTCGHFIQNDRSRRVIEKNGFQFLKMVSFETHYGTVEDTNLYILYAPKEENP